MICLFIPSIMCSGANATEGPIQRGDYFEYKIHETLKDCKGAYYGYDEDTKGTGRYEVVDIDGDNVTVHYEWQWRYESDTDPSASGRRDSTITFDRNTRIYLDGFDLDEPVPGEKAIWFWIDPEVEKGDTVRILDKNFTVTNVQATVWSNWLPRRAIELTWRGKGSRSDSYGDYSTTIVDRYYFAPESGYIIAERYLEPHDGYYEGERAEFDWKFNFDVTDSSYDRRIDYSRFFLYYVGLPTLIFLIAYGIYYGIRWAPRYYTTQDKKKLKIKRLRKFESRLPIVFEKTTTFFAPFIEDMVMKALAAKDRVAIASNAGEIIGVAIYHRDAKIGTVFALSTDVTEYLRKYVGAKDFFSETRHTEGKKGKGGDVYNIYETHKIFMKEIVEPEPYDRDLIRQMRPEDIPDICTISRKAYKIRGKRWFETLLAQGDIGIVAGVDERVVGFAFATIVDEHARLHSLTVDPTFRGKGIGKELMRARLTMIYHLGAVDALLEIADWNLPSLRISTTFGFTQHGKMYVETIRTKRVKRNIIRR